ncbi:hypothetical protein JAAARDRAFT_671689 [Jaapia argillacea MUCL 33604]|uniref:Uncharacterized protein n=1 Tax=Jaapia argillacea MUCL 33604 TaxID=933084 RepID=A0A067PUQ3_9AGAM|nr:hypothetical protein JAAARDRAFT_671689 [Jaapia argillacea MUCL 33604]
MRTTHSQIYPLCKSPWCLSRLRTTCSLWSFVRTGIVEKIWEEELPRETVVNQVKEKEVPTHPSLPPHVDPKSADPGPRVQTAAPLLNGHGQDDSTDHGLSESSSLLSALSEVHPKSISWPPPKSLHHCLSPQLIPHRRPHPPRLLSQDRLLCSRVFPAPQLLITRSRKPYRIARLLGPRLRLRPLFPGAPPREFVRYRSRPQIRDTSTGGRSRINPCHSPIRTKQAQVDVSILADVQPVQDRDQASIDNNTITQSTPKVEAPTLTGSAAISEAKPSEDGSDNGVPILKHLRWKCMLELLHGRSARGKRSQDPERICFGRGLVAFGDLRLQDLMHSGLVVYIGSSWSKDMLQ